MDLNDFWPKTPVFADIPRALKYLVSNDEPVFVLLIFSMIVSALFLFDGILNNAGDINERIIRFGIAFMPIIFVTGDFIYSAYINQRAGIFVLRYFLSVLPAALLSVSLLLSGILDKLTEN